MPTPNTRILPTHELNARRTRKRAITHLPGFAPRQAPASQSSPPAGARQTVPGHLLPPYNHPRAH
jgi:hypothetical protein